MLLESVVYFRRDREYLDLRYAQPPFQQPLNRLSRSTRAGFVEAENKLNSERRNSKRENFVFVIKKLKKAQSWRCLERV